MSRPLRIGISACFFHADPQRPIFKGKTLQYVEQSIARWVLAEGALAYLIPSPEKDVAPFRRGSRRARARGRVRRFADELRRKADPTRMGGRRVRDDYEISAVREFVARKKPVLGDLPGPAAPQRRARRHALPGHRLPASRRQDAPRLERLRSALPSDRDRAAPRCSRSSAGAKVAKVNTIHHQAIKSLGRGLVVEAKSEGDGIIEAVRWKGAPGCTPSNGIRSFRPSSDLLDTRPLLREFLKEAAASRA